MLLNLVLLILFIIVLISDINIIEGQEVQEVQDEPKQGDKDLPTPDTEKTKDTLFNVMNFFPGLFKNELVLYEKKHNEDSKEVYLSSLFESKGLYNELEEEKEQYKVVNQPNIIKECVDDSININDPFITEMVNKYKKQNRSGDNSNIKSNNKDLNFNLFGMDLNFNLNDSVSNNNNDDNPTNEYHNICELPSILYDTNTSITDRIRINETYGDCFDVTRGMYSKCRKSC